MKQFVFALGLTMAAALSAEAQATRAPEVPRDHRPPAGMCRVWLDNVPAGQQPAPTDCASAVRNRPSNGRVIFGDDYVQPQNKREPERGGGLLRTFVRPNGFAPQREPEAKPAPKPDDKKPDEKKKPERPDR